MIGDMLNNNKRRDVKTRVDQVMYMGKKYRREKGTGYYVCTTGKRKRLHDVIWETEHGMAVPPGCVIHHINWNKTDNRVENLLCVTVEEHNRIHNNSGGQLETCDSRRVREYTQELVKNRVNGVPGEVIKINKNK